jgi:hypothetical protein
MLKDNSSETNIEKGKKHRIKMQSCQELESQFNGTFKQYRKCPEWGWGSGQQSCKAAFAIAFNYNGGCTHKFPKENPPKGF